MTRKVETRTAHSSVRRRAGWTACMLTLAIVVLETTAWADRGWRVQGELILPGDSMAKVMRVAGAPDMRNRIESVQGGTLGNRWYYVFEGYNARTVIITFRGGRVADIRTERN